jgi:hypothetical protein
MFRLTRFAIPVKLWKRGKFTGCEHTVELLLLPPVLLLLWMVGMLLLLLMGVVVVIRGGRGPRFRFNLRFRKRVNLT